MQQYLSELIGAQLFSQISSQFILAKVEEVRLRANAPIVICSEGKNYALAGAASNYVLADDNLLNGVIARATQNSVYAVNDQIRQLFITYKAGIRIGITGQVVDSNNDVGTIKHINSLNIRLPHEVKGFANMALNFIVQNNKVASTLVVSSPGAGKTTLLRDICRGLGTSNKINNILLVDERQELAACIHGRPMLNVGLFTDIISGGTKQFAFLQGIRALKPNVIVTDELANSEDILAARNAVNSGVAVIASVHANSAQQLTNNPNFKSLLDDGIFTRIIVLSADNPNRYVGIYDNKLHCLYMPY